MTSAHGSSNSKQLHDYKCDQCPAVFAFDTSLYAHKTIEHKMAAPFHCTACPGNTAFYGATPYMQHLFQHSQDLQTGDNIACCLCGLDFPNQHGLRVHIRQHIPSDVLPPAPKFPPWQNKRLPMISCEFCPSLLRGVRRYKEHLQQHKQNKPFVCDICNRAFRIGHHLEQHRKVHRDLQNLPNDIVDKYFTNLTRGVPEERDDLEESELPYDPSYGD